MRTSNPLIGGLAALFLCQLVLTCASVSTDQRSYTPTKFPGYDGNKGSPAWPHNWGGGGVVLQGYDVIEYHNLDFENMESGVQGNPNFAVNLTSAGYIYEFWFVNKENMDIFNADPWRWAPKYGGFCAYGTSEEWIDNGWPWTEQVWGPPGGPVDGWVIHNGILHFNIWRSYSELWLRNVEEFVARADARWIDYFGSLQGGPFNTRCFPNTWRKCAVQTTNTVEPVYGYAALEIIKEDSGVTSAPGSFSGSSINLG